jgi:RNA polymerase sigma factor (sigma-70 family)
MVLGVCRRVLHNATDAEDAFQAAFIVLACKARSITRPELLGTWLYRVAFRAALRARAASARRRELPPTDIAVMDDRVERAELRHVLDEEIDRLPEKYRVSVVLCYLEGRTNEEAARRLRCPVGTIASRLATARERLRARLVRRGVTLTAGALAAALTADTLTAAVPAALTDAACAAAVQGAAATSAMILAKGVVRAMLLTRIRTTIIVLTILGLTGAGTGFIATLPWADAHPQERPPAQATEDDGAAKRLAKLLRERRDAAELAYSLRMRPVQNGQMIADNAFFAVAMRFHESEMALCQTRADRIKACENHLKRVNEADGILNAQLVAGKINQVDAAVGTYYRLDAEIRLERAKSGAK